MTGGEEAGPRVGARMTMPCVGSDASVRLQLRIKVNEEHTEIVRDGKGSLTFLTHDWAGVGRVGWGEHERWDGDMITHERGVRRNRRVYSLRTA